MKLAPGRPLAARLLSGLSRPVIEYLERRGFLHPAYAQANNPCRHVRFCSYRDMVVAYFTQRLHGTGIRLSQLKVAVERIAQDSFWADELTPAEGLNWLVNNGRIRLPRTQDGFLDDFLGGDQRAFAFVVNMGALLGNVRARMPEDNRKDFTITTAQLQFVPRTLAQETDRTAHV